MSAFGSADWYASMTGQALNPQHLSPSMMPYGQMPFAVNFYGNNLATSGYLATGGHQADPTLMAMQSLGKMFFPDLQLAPTGGVFSPMGRAIYEQQMREMSAAQASLMFGVPGDPDRGAVDMESMKELMIQLNRRITGAPREAVSEQAATQAQFLTQIMGSDFYNQMVANTPFGRMVEDFTGGTATHMFGEIYAATRMRDTGPQSGFEAEDIEDLVRDLDEKFLLPEDPVTGDRNRNMEFTQGLTRREIGQTTAELFRNFVIDPELMEEQDTEKFTEAIKKANKLTQSLRELFGPEAPVPELYRNLQQLTQGGLSQMDVNEMRTLVDRVKMTATTAGITMEGMQAIVSQGAMFAKQIGLPGPVGADIALDTTTIAGAILTGREQAPVWGQSDPNQVANEIMQAQFGMATSGPGVALMGVARFVDRMEREGVQFEGEDAATFTNLQDLVKRAEAGELTADDIARVENVQALSEDLGRLLPGGAAAATEYLTDRTANLEFRDDVNRGLQNAFFERVEESQLGNLQSVAEIGALAESSGMETREVSAKVLDALTSADDREGRVEAVENLLKTEFGQSDADASIAAETIYDNLASANEAITGHRFLSLDILTTRDQQFDAQDRVDRLVDAEQRARDLGIGSYGRLGQRLQAVLTSDTPVSTEDMLRTTLGMPSADDQRQLMTLLKDVDIQGLSGAELGLEQLERYGELVDEFTNLQPTFRAEAITPEERTRIENDIKAKRTEAEALPENDPRRVIVEEEVAKAEQRLAVAVTPEQQARAEDRLKAISQEMYQLTQAGPEQAQKLRELATESETIRDRLSAKVDPEQRTKLQERLTVLEQEREALESQVGPAPQIAEAERAVEQSRANIAAQLEGKAAPAVIAQVRETGVVPAEVMQSLAPDTAERVRQMQADHAGLETKLQELLGPATVRESERQVEQSRATITKILEGKAPDEMIAHVLDTGELPPSLMDKLSPEEAKQVTAAFDGAIGAREVLARDAVNQSRAAIETILEGKAPPELVAQILETGTIPAEVMRQLSPDEAQRLTATYGDAVAIEEMLAGKAPDIVIQEAARTGVVPPEILRQLAPAQIKQLEQFQESYIALEARLEGFTGARDAKASQLAAKTKEYERVQNQLASLDLTPERREELEARLEEIQDETKELRKGNVLDLVMAGEESTQIQNLLGGIKFGLGEGGAVDLASEQAAKLREFLESDGGKRYFSAMGEVIEERQQKMGVDDEEIKSSQDVRQDMVVKLDAIQKMQDPVAKRASMEQFLDNYGELASALFQVDDQGRLDFAKDIGGLEIEATDPRKSAEQAIERFVANTMEVGEVRVGKMIVEGDGGSRDTPMPPSVARGDG